MTLTVADVRAAPSDVGRLELVVRRPAVGEREVMVEGILDPTAGLVGDSWSERPTPNPDAQLNIMSARAAALIAGDRSRWPLAGDQLYLDFDLSLEGAPAGTQLAIGTSVIEITAKPHTGCAKFSARFGADNLGLVNSPEGKELRLRGACAKVVVGGVVRPGDEIRRLG